jgi:hypothetical protein
MINRLIDYSYVCHIRGVDAGPGASPHDSGVNKRYYNILQLTLWGREARAVDC